MDLPINEGASNFRIDLKNKGQRRVRARQDPGGLAQLGERYNGIVEVIGSSPLSSIERPPTSIRRRLFFCSDRSNSGRKVRLIRGDADYSVGRVEDAVSLQGRVCFGK